MRPPIVQLLYMNEDSCIPRYRPCRKQFLFYLNIRSDNMIDYRC